MIQVSFYTTDKYDPKEERKSINKSTKTSSGSTTTTVTKTSGGMTTTTTTTTTKIITSTKPGSKTITRSSTTTNGTMNPTSTMTKSTTSTSTKNTAPSKVTRSATTNVTKHVTETTKIYESPSGGEKAFSVKVLNTTLRNGLEHLKNDLNQEQNDIFINEDERVGTLADLENEHKQLENDHINDQAFGAHLNRLNKQIMSEISIAKSGLEDDQDLLKRQIGHTQDIIEEITPIVETERKETASLQDTLNQTQGQQQTPETVALLTENEELRKKFNDSRNLVHSERTEKVKFFNDHADLVNKYNQLVVDYTNSLNKLEVDRTNDQNELNLLNIEASIEDAEEINLNHYVETSEK